MAGAGLAGAGLGAGLAATYNQGFGGGGYGYRPMMQPGYGNSAAAYGGPMTLPSLSKGGKGGGKGGGGGKGNKGGKTPVTEQPPAGFVPVGGWLALPPGYELPEGIPKGLEVGGCLFCCCLFCRVCRVRNKCIGVERRGAV